MSDLELRGEVERLTNLNHRLSSQIIGMSDTLESGRRELLATGWDAAVTEADRRWQLGSGSVAILKADNPYRKPALDFSGAMICKMGEDS